MTARSLAVSATMLLAPAVAFANMVFVNFDNFNYTGSVTRYANLADTQAGTNAMGSSPIATATNDTRTTLPGARDGTLFVDSGAPDAYNVGDYATFATAWYFTTFAANGLGWGNPNNTCPGFTQYVDDGTGGLQGSVSGGWSNSLSQFTLGVSGGSGDSGGNARNWAGGSGCGDAGQFRSFNLNLVADFAGSASLNAGTGLYEIDANPTAVSGGLTAIFENDSTTTTNNGFYVMNLQFHNGSWADANGATWSYEDTTFSPEAFFASDNVAIPEPLSTLLVATALLAAGASRRRTTKS